MVFFGTRGFKEGELYNSDDLKNFYPNSLLITGFDILFFWVARMMFQSTNALKQLPFKEVYLHALVKDELGRKMSKSLGNIIDPKELIKDYSADILRFTLALLAIQGRDIRLSDDKLVQVRNFTNKLYNATNYLLLNEKSFKNLDDIDVKSELGKYILSRFNLCIKELRENLDTYRFNDAATVLYRFFWDEFCDFGIELSKAEKSSVAELGAIFKEALKALSVFMPFISEYLYHKLSGTSLENDESIMIKPYPKFSKRDEEAEKLFALIIESIVSIRRAKSLLELTKIKKAYIKLNDESLKHSLQKYKHFISLLSKSEDVDFVDTKMKDCSSDISVNLESFVPLEGLDLSAILNRLSSQESKLQKEKEKLSSMLSNENFVKNAPKELVLQNQKALESVNERLLKVQTELSNLRSLSD